MVINIMNRILISRDKIEYDSLKVNVSGNVIKFPESGIYSVEYENIEKVDYCFLISDKRAVILSECSFSGNLIVNNKYIVDNITKTGCLVEVGFLSNLEESIKLNSDDYQSKLAYAIYAGILSYLESI